MFKHADGSTTSELRPDFIEHSRETLYKCEQCYSSISLGPLINHGFNLWQLAIDEIVRLQNEVERLKSV